MRLAGEPTLISFGSSTARLRPSLRAAYLLQRQHGIGVLMDGIQNNRLAPVLGLIETTADDPATARDIIIARIQAHGIRSLSDLAPLFYQLLADTYGIDPDVEHPVERDPGKPFNMRKALEDLFEFATGWLQWSPAETWAATVTEILAAQRGHYTKLRAIHGGSDNDTDTPADPLQELTPEELAQERAKLRDIMRRA